MLWERSRTWSIICCTLDRLKPFQMEMKISIPGQSLKRCLLRIVPYGSKPWILFCRICARRRESREKRPIVTCLSKLFNSGVEEKLIRERTKHRSNANMPMRKQVRRKFLRYQPVSLRRQKKIKKIKVQQIRRKELKGFSFLNVSSFTNCDVTFLSRKKNELAVWLINYDGWFKWSIVLVFNLFCFDQGILMSCEKIDENHAWFWYVKQNKCGFYLCF